jgi:hypothetical protein
MTPCNELNTTRGVRCVRDPHDSTTLHRAGLFVWGSQTPEVAPQLPEWLARSFDGRTNLGRDETGRVAL